MEKVAYFGGAQGNLESTENNHACYFGVCHAPGKIRALEALRYYFSYFTALLQICKIE